MLRAGAGAARPARAHMVLESAPAKLGRPPLRVGRPQTVLGALSGPDGRVPAHEVVMAALRNAPSAHPDAPLRTEPSIVFGREIAKVRRIMISRVERTSSGSQRTASHTLSKHG